MLETTYLISFIGTNAELQIDTFNAADPVDACFLCRKKHKIHFMDICSVVAGYSFDQRLERKKEENG